MKNIGLQMYTVRELLSKNVEETLLKVKSIGYDSIQLAGSLELMEETAKCAKKLGIKVVGMVVGFTLCENEYEKIFEICRMCGATDIGTGVSVTTYEDAMNFVERANEFAKIAAKEGFTVSYHNHSHEFIRTENGQIIMDIYRENLKGIDFMLDTYWIQHGGGDVRQVIETFKGRVKILHLKDMERSHEGPTFAPVGSGNLYFEGIIKTAKECGVEQFVVEQDICKEDPFICIEKSIKHLKGVL